jgi:SAM-dependent methyltransferase
LGFAENCSGTGIWAIEFSNQYPNSSVTGTDLSAIQPTYLPPNCSFIIDDAEDPWAFSHKFDYIHGRALLSCFRNPREVFKSAFENLVPGGYLELQDAIFPFKYIGDTPVDSDLYKWSQIVTEGAAKSGRPWTNAQYYRQWMEELGFENVVEKFYYWPTSQWAKGKYFKEVAMYWQEDLLQGIEGMSLKVMTLLGWKADDIREFLVKVKEDVKNKDIHAYLSIVVVYGRKPMATSR